jgi:hypothetical protein
MTSTATPAASASVDASRSHFANADAARQALQMALPMIEPQMTVPEVCGSGFLYIVVMDPAMRPGESCF